MAQNLHPRSPNHLSNSYRYPGNFTFHTVPSSGKVERMNRIIKETLTKLTLEVHLDWTKLLPIVLLRIRALPRKPLGLSPSEVRYGRPRLPPGLPLSLLPFQASYTPLYWRSSAMPSGDMSTTICLPLPPKPPCPLYKLGTWSV